MLTALRFLIGAFMGLTFFGLAITLAMPLGVPTGPGWWVVLAPFTAFTGWWCAASK